MALVPALASQPPGSWRVEKLPSLSNRVFRVTGAAGDYVLRLANEAPYLDRVRETHNHRLAAGIDLAPPTLFDDPARGVLLTAFQPQAETFDLTANRDGAILAVARSLQRLHASGLQFKGEMRLVPTMEEYLAIAGSAGLRVASVWDTWRRDVTPILTRLELHLVPSHVDPVPRNILIAPADDGAVAKFVDWEYSAPAAPVWDLADFAIEANLNHDEESALLSGYGIAADSNVEAAFHLYKPMLDLLAAAWAASQVTLHGSRIEQEGMVEARLARAQVVLDRPGFGAMLAACRAH